MILDPSSCIRKRRVLPFGLAGKRPCIPWCLAEDAVGTISNHSIAESRTVSENPHDVGWLQHAVCCRESACDDRSGQEWGPILLSTSRAGLSSIPSIKGVYLICKQSSVRQLAILCTTSSQFLPSRYSRKAMSTPGHKSFGSAHEVNVIPDSIVTIIGPI